ncbi:MAG TPA: hypothetical protein ENJ08_05605 [Gammaproteobacteria bacterium]|nr:hypothetical protein [Gammaproteobacteria bacterium]
MTSRKKSASPLSTELTAQTTEFLNLSKQPFNAEILSETSFFSGQALEKISDSLIHQVQFSELLLIVEGPHGSGKTALFRQFIQTEINNTKILSMQAEATDTLVQIQQKMSIHLQDMGDANHLDDNLKSLQMFDQTPLAIIDCAHVLSDTTLQELLRYQQQLKQGKDVTLKLLLFANTGIAETLQNITDISPDQMYVQRMPEYSAKQTDAFIKHKLKLAGYTGESLLDANAIQQLFKKSKGIPLEMMQIAAPMIDKIVLQKIKPVTGNMKKTLTLSLILLVIAGGGAAAYFILDADSTPTAPLAENTAALSEETAFIEETPNTSTPTEAQKIPDEISAQDEHPAEESLDANAPETMKQETMEQETSQLETIEPETTGLKTEEQQTSAIEAADLEENTSAIHTEPAGTAPASIIPSDKTAKPATPPRDLTSDSAPNSTRSNRTASTNKAPVAAQQNTAAPIQTTGTAQQHNKSVEILPEKQPEKQPEPPVTQPETEKPPHPAIERLRAAGVHDVSWLMQQPAGNWTLQFLGARSPLALLKFAKKYPLDGNGIWYKSSLRGQPYYVLIYGSYPSRDAARNAVSKLTPELRAIKPWVKSLKAVQQALE